MAELTEDQIDQCMAAAERVFGWARGDKGRELARVCGSAPDGAVVVEVGAFFGSGTVLLATARKLAGSGEVHTVDSFDGGGDTFSQPYYREELRKHGATTFREAFDAGVNASGVAHLITAHAGNALEIGRAWTRPIDMLFLDGDQGAGAYPGYLAWTEHLKPGGLIAINNTSPYDHPPDHGGSLEIVQSEDFAARFADHRRVDDMSFAVRR